MFSVSKLGGLDPPAANELDRHLASEGSQGGGCVSDWLEEFTPIHTGNPSPSDGEVSYSCLEFASWMRMEKASKDMGVS